MPLCDYPFAMAIHVAITRQVRPGCEAEFQEALREFFQASFSHDAVLGASMLTPGPGTDSREFGILRTFASEADRDAFYQSPLFQEWEKRARTMTEGEAIYRPLHGLEAWFRSPSNPPPRWKMAVTTALGVYPTSLLLGETIGRWTHAWPVPARAAVFAVAMVALLTWVVMPLVARVLHPWLHPETKNLK
jgi:antibiotic biosynthesis monooxygenase (ABM) superfamily enzyme